MQTSLRRRHVSLRRSNPPSPSLADRAHPFVLRSAIASSAVGWASSSSPTCAAARVCSHPRDPRSRLSVCLLRRSSTRPTPAARTSPTSSRASGEPRPRPHPRPLCRHRDAARCSPRPCSVLRSYCVQEARSRPPARRPARSSRAPLSCTDLQLRRALRLPDLWQLRLCAFAHRTKELPLSHSHHNCRSRSPLCFTLFQFRTTSPRTSVRRPRPSPRAPRVAERRSSCTGPRRNIRTAMQHEIMMVSRSQPCAFPCVR